MPTPPLKTRRDPWRAGWLLALAALCFAGGAIVTRNGIMLVRNDALEDDSAQHTFWAQRAWDSRILEVDPLARYFASDAAAPFGYYWTLQGLSRLGEIQLMTELAELPLIAVTLVLVWMLGRRVANGSPSGGLAAVVLTLTLPMLHESLRVALLQRHFTIGIHALALLGLLERRLWMPGLALLVAALFYPIAIATVGLIVVVHELWQLARTRMLPAGWYWGFGLGLIALGFFIARDVPEAYGFLVTLEQAKEMPIFSNDGRSAFFHDDPWHYFVTSGRSGMGSSVLELAGMLIVSVGLIALAGWRRVPRLAWLTLLVGLVLWAAAHAVLYKLYLPQRHVVTTLPLAFIMLVAATIEPALRRARAIFWRRAASRPGCRPFPWLASPTPLVAAATAFIAVAGFQGLIGLYWTYRNVNSTPHRAGVMEYLRTLPPEALYAGPPNLMDNFPLRTGRAALASRESMQAYYPDYYYAISRPRMRATMEAIEADTWEEVDRLYDEYGVRVFVWEELHMEYEPTEQPQLMFREAARAANPGEPVLNDPPPDRILYQDDLTTLIRVGPILDSHPPLTARPDAGG